MAELGENGAHLRKEAWSKVAGGAKYTADFYEPGMLHARLFVSQCAHGRIKSVDTSAARALNGVRAVLTGEDTFILCGGTLRDRPPLARVKVRYFGEPVALVAAEDEKTAAEAAALIRAEYEALPVVHTPSQALMSGAPLVHDDPSAYFRPNAEVRPQKNSNICDVRTLRKGDALKALAESPVTVEARFFLPRSDHVAMEPRAARASIDAEGRMHILTASQSPFEVQKLLAAYFGLRQNMVRVETPLVGGAFGGKSAVQLEVLACLASAAVGGRPVRLVNPRESDMVASPCRAGFEAWIRLGASQKGRLLAAQMEYRVDTGAYADIGPIIARAVMADCTGPYRIDHVWCDACAVYTNHTYSSPFRGFGHEAVAFCMERAIDKLAQKLQMDAVALRAQNAIRENDVSPTGVRITLSNTGNLSACIERARELIGYDAGSCAGHKNGIVRAKGFACFWKTSNSPTDAVSGAVVTCNADGTLNLNCGCVEFGSGAKSVAAQILAMEMGVDTSLVHVNLNADTLLCPEHWKTVASMTTFMLGRAVVRAADDLKRRLKAHAALVLRCPEDELEVGDSRVYARFDPLLYVAWKDLVHGVQYSNGNAAGAQIIAYGGYVTSNLSVPDPETGRGQTGDSWTVGAQAAEVEYDKKEMTYRILRLVSVLDAGRVLNPVMARSVVRGGMCMGVGLATRESFVYDALGVPLDTSLRTYKLMHFGEQPQYVAEFVETPQLNAPHGARGIAEHGILGVAPAVANALSLAAGAQLDTLPITPESIWHAAGGAV
ncbi:MAG: xanthine dehydrogenase family protein molybdopterin-binding subunit [Eubacteriales bacterium]|nr:xanthine dehydrogenase family protein molybdopterin-binding subunit [Eubacteriales bacterium]